MEDNNENNEKIENNQEILVVENQETETQATTENKEEGKIETVNSIKISNDAVAMYVGIAVAEIQGVYGMSGTLAGITEAISRKKELYKRCKS